MFSWPDPHQTRVQCPGSHITTVNIFAFYIHFQCCVLKSKRWMLIALLKILVLLKCNGKMLFVVCLTIPLIKDLVYTVNINDFLHVPSSVEKINHNALNWKKTNKTKKADWLTFPPTVADLAWCLNTCSGSLWYAFKKELGVMFLEATDLHDVTNQCVQQLPQKVYWISFDTCETQY